MKNIIILIIVILTIPLFGFLTAYFIQMKYEYDWQNVLKKEIRDINHERLKSLSLKNLCVDPNKASNLPICSRYNLLTIMKQGSVITAIFGLSLLFIIALAGKISIINRYLLLYLFKPGLYFTFLFLIILIVLHAAIAMACLYFIEAVLFGKIHILIILGIGFGAIVGIAIMIQASFSIIKNATISVVGKCLIEEENPLLWQCIKNITKKIGTSLPDHIVAGLETNFFVTEASVFCLDGELSGKTMFISLPLCRILSVKEFEAVIAHELSHFKGMDTQFSKKFFPIYKGTIESLNGIAGHIEEGEAYVIALLPAFYMLSFFLWSFAVAEKKISRERELAADKIAGEISGPKNLAIALVKIVAFSKFMDVIYDGMKDILKHGKQIINASCIFYEIAFKNANKEVLRDIDGQTLHHPIDSHPPLKLRLDALNCSLIDIEDSALNIKKDASAIHLINNYDKFEENLTEITNYFIMRSLQDDGQIKPKKEGV